MFINIIVNGGTFKLDTNYLAPIITVFGLLICFCSTYFRKICSAMIGFVWGTVLSGAVMLVLGLLGSVALSNNELLGYSIFVGTVIAVICYMFEKLAAVINSFIFFAIAAIIIGLALVDDLFGSLTVLLVIAVIAGTFGAALQIIFDKYAFAVITAFSGAMIAGIGIISMTKGGNLESPAYYIFNGDIHFFSSLPIYTIVLGSLGTAFQLYGLSLFLKNNRDKQGGLSEKDSNRIELAVIKDFLKNNIIAVIAPCIAVLLPVIAEWISNIGSVTKTRGDFVYYTEAISVAFMLGCAVFLLLKGKAKSTLGLLIAYNVFYVIANYYNYFISDYRWPITATTFKGVGTAAILLVLNYLIKNKDVKSAIFPFVSYLSFDYVMNWISSRDLFAISINAKYIIMLGVAYCTVFALHYLEDHEIVYGSNLCIIFLLVVILVSFGLWSFQRWQIVHRESEAKGGWENYTDEQKEYKKNWKIIKKDNEYAKLIKGGTTADQLREALMFFDSPVDSDDIDRAFDENSYWYTFRICDRPEEKRDENTEPLSLYEYDLKRVNSTLAGLTNFRFKDNTWYGDDPAFYTENGKLYIYVVPKGYDLVRTIKNVRGRYNDEEMIVDYDIFDIDYYSGSTEPEETFLYSLSAIFVKNDKGKFKLDRIDNYKQESSKNEVENENSSNQKTMLNEGVWTCTRGQTLGMQSLIKFNADGSFDEYFFGSDQLTTNAGVWSYDSGTETLILNDNASYTDGREETFVKDGDSFRSTEMVEMMEGSDYQWISPDKANRVDLFN